MTGYLFKTSKWLELVGGIFAMSKSEEGLSKGSGFGPLGLFLSLLSMGFFANAGQ